MAKYGRDMNKQLKKPRRESLNKSREALKALYNRELDGEILAKFEDPKSSSIFAKFISKLMLAFR